MSQDKIAVPLTVVLCPGFHPPALTQMFWQQLQTVTVPPIRWVVVPGDRCPPYSVPDILQVVQTALPSPAGQPIVFIGFSAGVVGAMGTAIAWHALGGQVQALFAIDGWGVPCVGPFPIHRLSHDAFTHWSSALLGAGQDSFYADPAVEHLDLWRSPQTVQGWWITSNTPPQATTALAFLAFWLAQQAESSSISHGPIYH